MLLPTNLPIALLMLLSLLASILLALFYKVLPALQRLSYWLKAGKKTERPLYQAAQFNQLLLELNKIGTYTELESLTQRFFQEAFALSRTHVHLGIMLEKDKLAEAKLSQRITAIHSVVEHYYVRSGKAWSNCARTRPQPLQAPELIVRSELELQPFSALNLTPLFRLLLDVDADMIIPLYHHNFVMGYIVVDPLPLTYPALTREETEYLQVYAQCAGAVMLALHMHYLSKWQTRMPLAEPIQNRLKQQISPLHTRPTALKTSGKRYIVTNGFEGQC